MKIMDLISKGVLSLTLLFQACDEVDRTYAVIGRDQTKKPVITTITDVSNLSSYSGEEFSWEFNIEAYNGIQDIILNGEVVRSFGNGQLIFDAKVYVEMSADPTMALELEVTDEIGNSTIYPTVNVTSKGVITSPYTLLDFAYNDVVRIEDDSAEEPQFTAEAMATWNLNANKWWNSVKVNSSIEGVERVKCGTPWSIEATFPYVHAYGQSAPDHNGESVDNAWRTRFHFKEYGSISIYKPLNPKAHNLIILPTHIPEPIIKGISNGTRVFKIDVYVDTQNTLLTNNVKNFDFNIEKHSMLSFGMINSETFSTSSPRAGQDYGLTGYIGKTDEWETITFQLDPTNTYSRTLGDVDFDEVDGIQYYISAQENSGNVSSNAFYYFKNLRVELKN